MAQALQTTPQAAVITPDLIDRVWNQAKEIALDYPLLLTIATVALAALGITLLVAEAVLAGVVSFAAMSLCAAPLVSEYSHILNIVCSPPDHPMTEHVFTEKSCEGGRLYYHNDVPILQITAEDPKQAGFVHGYLAGKNIHEIWKKYLSIALPIVSGSLCGATYFKESLSQVEIPQEYRMEMEGLAAGYNRWLEEYEKETGLYFSSQRLTLEDVMAWHAFLDLAKATPQPCYLKHATLGCSTAACLENESIYVGRNLDWEGLGVVGKNSLVILRSPSGSRRTAIIGCAGAIGCLTGMNDRGVVTVVNEGGWNFNKKGMPYNLWHRKLLERADSVEDARALMKVFSPAGSHILTVADPKTAAVFEMQLSEETFKNERSLNAENFLAATNHFHTSDFKPIKDGCFGWDTEGRMGQLTQVMSSKDPKQPLPRLHEGLQSVQSKETFQTILLDPKERRIYLNFNNSFAADEESLRLLSSNILF